MDALRIDAPWHLHTDVGPVIDEEARAGIAAHIQTARAECRLIHEIKTPNSGCFVAPTLIRVTGIGDLEREIFGPVLHVATFAADELDDVSDAINATGYGLTFGLMTRIDDRVQHVSERIGAGNIYINRNQLGAIVGSQPFGGEGLSGTGPKAGGPHYLARFTRHDAPLSSTSWGNPTTLKLTEALGYAEPDDASTDILLPGPTGESNRLSVRARAPLLCLGPGKEAAAAQAKAIRDLGGRAIELAGDLDASQLETLEGFAGAIWWGDEAPARAYTQALSRRNGPILPLITGLPDLGHARHERHVCVDTTAAGGNAALLGGAA